MPSAEELCRDAIAAERLAEIIGYGPERRALLAEARKYRAQANELRSWNPAQPLPADNARDELG